MCVATPSPGTKNSLGIEKPLELEVGGVDTLQLSMFLQDIAYHMSLHQLSKIVIFPWNPFNGLIMDKFFHKKKIEPVV